MPVSEPSGRRLAFAKLEIMTPADPRVPEFVVEIGLLNKQIEHANREEDEKGGENGKVGERRGWASAMMIWEGTVKNRRWMDAYIACPIERSHSLSAQDLVDRY
jgi:hypothetical protein